MLGESMPTELNTRIRLDPASLYALRELAARRSITAAAVIRQELRRAAREEGIEIPPELAGPRPYPRRRQASSR